MHSGRKTGLSYTGYRRPWGPRFARSAKYAASRDEPIAHTVPGFETYLTSAGAAGHRAITPETPEIELPRSGVV